MSRDRNDVGAYSKLLSNPTTDNLNRRTHDTSFFERFGDFCHVAALDFKVVRFREHTLDD